MIVAFDTSTLIFLLKPDAPAPHLPGSEERVSDCHRRISHLLNELQKARATIIIPTPVIAELLVKAGAAAPEWLRILTTSRHFRPSPFDLLAAVECSAMARVRHGGERMSRAAKHKAKFDEQIVAIARVERATVIYAEDGDIEKLAGDGIQVRGIASLELPPEDRQPRLFNEPDDVDEDLPPAQF